MRTGHKRCQNCNDVTEHERLGFIPPQVIFGGVDESYSEWVQTDMCTECGSVDVVAPTSEQLDRAEERYMKRLVANGIITEQEAQEVLNP